MGLMHRGEPALHCCPVATRRRALHARRPRTPPTSRRRSAQVEGEEQEVIHQAPETVRLGDELPELEKIEYSYKVARARTAPTTLPPCHQKAAPKAPYIGARPRRHFHAPFSRLALTHTPHPLPPPSSLLPPPRPFFRAARAG